VQLKLLMFYAKSFWSQTYQKTLAEAPDQEGEQEAQEAVAVFYQAEAEDVGRESAVTAKLVKNVKWLAGKFGLQTVLLHSFGHLSTSKGPPEVARAVVEAAKEKLVAAGFTVSETPFGYLNEWKMHVAGPSLAKVFKEI
jgi:hypothetical protein